jgi:acyl-coenzyme A thioesterase 9
LKVRPLDTSITQILPLGADPGLRRSFRFGVLLEVLDRLAEQTALAYLGKDRSSVSFVTAAIDQIRLHGPLDATHDLTMLSRVNYVGTSSLEVGIRVEQPSDVHFGSCYFTMVAQPRGVELPPLSCEDGVETRRKEEAMERRATFRNVAGPDISPPTRAEQALLAELHMAQEGVGFDGLVVSDLTARSYEPPEHAGAPVKISGGYVTHRAYLHAAMCAELVAPERALLVAVNRINFLAPARADDTLHFTSRVTYTGATSICVEVDIVRESQDRSTAALCNTATFTFANVDARLRACPVPRVYPSTYAEDLRYLAAHRRRQSRLEAGVY